MIPRPIADAQRRALLAGLVDLQHELALVDARLHDAEPHLVGLSPEAYGELLGLVRRIDADLQHAQELTA